MENEKDPAEKVDTPAASGADSNAPADALSRTPEELGEEASSTTSESPAATDASQPVEKKQSPIKQFFKKVNLYFLLFMVVLVVVAVIAAVNYLNSAKPADDPTVQGQALSQEALKQLANKDASIGDTSQTLTIQGNAVIAGQTLTRGDLNVAGDFQTAGSIQGPSITISGAANLGETQANALQVATNAAVQGSTTLRDLSVAGSATFSGPVTVSQLTASRLILSGNAVLQIPNHISFTGPAPTRSLNSGVVGSGGSVSVNGSDTSGTVNISTGGSPQPGCFTRISFAQRFTGQPRVIVSPVGRGAGLSEFYVDRDATGFSICTANGAPANQAFAFDYFIAG
jgi:cytoskeletal protein CcmA (bactofilin family)